MVVIVITGVPGSGKTTIAKKLSEKLRGIYINLVEYAKKNKDKYVIDYDEMRDTYVINEDKLLSDIERFIEKEKHQNNIIIESHFSHLINKKLVDLFVYLTVDPNEQAKRLKNRGYNYHKIFENVFVNNLDLIEDELRKNKINYIKIDTTKKDPEEIVGYILSIITNKNNNESL